MAATQQILVLLPARRAEAAYAICGPATAIGGVKYL
jgi:hypothetical protein